MKCPKCKVNATKYGITKSKYSFKQRYYCKYCEYTFSIALEKTYKKVYLEDIFLNKIKIFEDFFKSLLDNKSKDKELKNKLKNMLKILIENNIPLKITEALINKRFKLRTLQRMKNSVINHSQHESTPEYNISINKNMIQNKTIQNKILIKEYQYIPTETEVQNLGDNVDKILNIKNLENLFKKFQEEVEKNQEEIEIIKKSFINDLKEMYISAPNEGNRSKSIKNKLKKIVKINKNRDSEISTTILKDDK